MKLARTTKTLRTAWHSNHLFIVQKAQAAHTGRARTTRSPRYRVFTVGESPDGTFLTQTWVGTVPTIRGVKSLILHWLELNNQAPKKDS